MREIKFRAWDGKKMYYLEDETFWLIGKSNYFELQDHRAEHFDTVESVNGYKDLAVINNSDGNDTVLMQHTGLKDVNDKEIYEGDIVKISDGWPFREFELCVIEYHKYGIPYIIQRYLKNSPGTGDYNFDFLKDAYASGINSYYEVIGNIYETPELLNIVDNKI